MRVVTIDKREELNKYFGEYGMGGFKARVKDYDGEIMVLIEFFDMPCLRLKVPIGDIIIYAGFLPPKKREHTFQDSVEEVRRVRELQEEYYKKHGHVSYEECGETCKLLYKAICTYCFGDGKMIFDKSSDCHQCNGNGFINKKG